MGGDRDLAVIGAGAGAALLTLLLPLPFGLRALIAFLLMGLGILAAFLRLGPDRLPPEVLLWRRLRFSRTPRRRVYMRGPAETAPFPEAPAAPLPRAPRPAARGLPGLSVSLEAAEIPWAVRMSLAVAGAYFLWWLALEGGARELAMFLQTILGGR